MKSHNRIPRSRILLVAVVVLLAVVICAELLAMRAMREKADASDVIQTLPEGDGETEPAVVAALEQARSKLVVDSNSTKILEVVKLAASTPVGKQIALKITTTPDVAELSVEGVTMTLCTGKVQTLNTGKTVKIWLVYIPATTAGKYTYTIYAGSASAQVDVTVN